MKRFMALFTVVTCLFISGMSSVLAGTQTIVYPTAENPAFAIQIPDSWELEQAEEEGDYFHVSGPSGAMFAFCTIPVENEEDAVNDLEAAIQAAVEFLQENYSDVELGEPKDDQLDGCEGFYATGTGVDEDGDDVVFGMGWYVLPDGTIAEIWFVTTSDDEAGLKQATNILRSFDAP